MTLNTNVTQPDITEREDKAWVEIINEKKEKNKIDRLEDYVSKGQGIHIEDARKMYEGFLWANIDRYKYIEKYVQYFPNGQYINQVEDKVFRSVENRYIDLFPKGRYIEQAKNADENRLLKEIKEGWAMSIDEYIEKYPQGKYIDQIDEIVWQQALNEESQSKAFQEQGFEKYIKHFPAGKHSAGAREKIKKYKN